MGFVHERTDSGLLLARQGVEGAAVAKALREHDPCLVLQPKFSEQLGTYWTVYSTQFGGWTEVCAWVDHERKQAKPLTMGLVDRVKELDRNGRGDVVESDEANAKHREALREEAQRRLEDLAEDWVPREKRRAVLPRGVHLRQARSRTGYHDMKRSPHG